VLDQRLRVSEVANWGRVSGVADAREAGARLIMEFSGRHIVVTGGTGALGAAVVGTLVKGGASCNGALCA